MGSALADRLLASSASPHSTPPPDSAAGKRCSYRFAFLLLLLLAPCVLPLTEAAYAPGRAKSRNAYATMIYMGTPRDYEFYVAARVMLNSLARLDVNADRVMIASDDVPVKWLDTLRNENVTVLTVKDIDNPYKNQPKFDKRFISTLNKLYAWTLTKYDRVVMLDADNLFMRAPDELFRCGNFCASFINPCIFHTGLFVLEPSWDTYDDMRNELEKGRENADGADQGFLSSYFDHLLEAPLFNPSQLPSEGGRLTGNHRLPMGYQMDASYFYLKLKWPRTRSNLSVVTFPSVPMLKPWYWWSWPVLPLGLEWHNKKLETIGYAAERTFMIAASIFSVATLVIGTIIRRRNPTCDRPPMKCLGRGACSEQSLSCHPVVLKAILLASMVASFAIPFYVIPTTVHPLMGWGVFLLSSLGFLVVLLCVFPALAVLPVVTPWLCVVGALVVLAFPYYNDGIMRALAIGVFAFLASPWFWKAVLEVMRTADLVPDREPLMGWTAIRSDPQSELMKLC
eukprot:TRINITY_DN17062_c0_g1_i1.p1 TRINITY_DN17062_c0_g1~~TRINITY_DN17062_c0_g1_i1.p1  ORF type:complete len:511 (+),score=43.46 TRINITY_DN17062_c0_g1_i1:549-2081(+)